MALTAATKSARVARLVRAIAEHETVTANAQRKIDDRKKALKELQYDLAHLRKTRAVGENSVAVDEGAPED